MTGDEPPDVQQYAATNPTFPFETTLDQFFDEPQFESYRALGFHVAQTAFKEALDDVNDDDPLWSYRDPEQEFRRGNQRLFFVDPAAMVAVAARTTTRRHSGRSTRGPASRKRCAPTAR